VLIVFLYSLNQMASYSCSRSSGGSFCGTSNMNSARTDSTVFNTAPAEQVKSSREAGSEEIYSILMRNEVHEFPDLVKYIRLKKACLTQRLFAIILGITYGRLTSIENGVNATIYLGELLTLKSYMGDLEWVVDVYFEAYQRVKGKK
jgi:hypothetical protein